MLRQVLVDQQDHFFHEPIEIDRQAMIGVAPGSRQAEHSTRDGRGSLAGVEDPGQGPLAIGRIRIAQSELGVVDDRCQRVVQLVKNATRQNSQTADPLQGDDLTP